MTDRPKLKLRLTATDKTAELPGWVLRSAIGGLAIVTFQSLPDTIPVRL